MQCKETCPLIKLYFVTIISMAISVRFFKVYTSFVAFFLMVIVPIVFFKKDLKSIGYRNFTKGFFWGVVSLLVLSPLVFICSAISKNIYLGEVVNSFIAYLPMVIAEETFFRGYFYSQIENETLIGPISKVNLISSFLFTSACVWIYYDPAKFLAFFPSLAMGYLYEKSSSILAPIIFHLGINFIYTLFPC
ncbi:MAG: CPBP family intramembrane glutamic endopeptidase [Desulfurobacteriaceae bacterium]